MENRLTPLAKKLFSELLIPRIDSLEKSNDLFNQIKSTAMTDAQTSLATLASCLEKVDQIIKASEVSEKKEDKPSKKPKQADEKKPGHKITKSKSLPKINKDKPKPKTPASKKTLPKLKSIDTTSKKSTTTVKSKGKSTKGLEKSKTIDKNKKTIVDDLNLQTMPDNMDDNEEMTINVKSPFATERKEVYMNTENDDLSEKNNSFTDKKFEEDVKETTVETVFKKEIHVTDEIKTEEIVTSPFVTETEEVAVESVTNEITVDIGKEAKINWAEIFESNFLKIASFLEIHDYLNFASCNRHCRLTGLSNLQKREKEQHEQAEQLVDEQKETYTEKKLNEEIPLFTVAKGSAKATDLLNEESYSLLFENETFNPKILIVYRMYAYLFFPEIDAKLPDKQFWELIRKKFLEMKEPGMGNKVKELISDSVRVSLDDEGILKFRKFLGANNEINPTIFAGMCSTSGFLAFFLKDLLSYLGISKDKKTPSSRLYKYYSYVALKRRTNAEKLQAFKNKL